MENMEGYYTKYTEYSDAGDTGGTTTIDPLSHYAYGYTCPHCKAWVPTGGYHECWGDYPWHYTYSTNPENKTEKAFKILKALVKDGIIPEPKSFKAFCELIEKIAKAV